MGTENPNSFVGLFKGIKDDNVNCRIVIKNRDEPIVVAIDVLSIGNDSVEVITEYTKHNEWLETIIIPFDQISKVETMRSHVTLKRERTIQSVLPSKVIE